MKDEQQEDESVRHDIMAAFKEAEPRDEPEPQDAPDQEAPAEAADDEPQGKAAEPKEAAGDKAAGDKSEAAEKKDDGAEPLLDPPAKWEKEDKELFATADPKIQGLLHKRNKQLEADYTRKMQAIAQERQRYNEFEQILGPRREAWTRSGFNDAQALNSIMSYWDLSQRDPMQFIDVFARERGIDLRSMYGQQQQGTPSPADVARYIAEYGDDEDGGNVRIPAELQQRLDSYEMENQQLRQYVQQVGGSVENMLYGQQREMEQAARQSLADFQNATDERGNPMHPFLDEVREDMIVELRVGGAKDYKEAYDRAVWRNPSTRQKLLESQEITRRQEDERKRQEEAARARRAAASVSGGPSVSSVAPMDDDDDNLSLRDLIKKQIRDAEARERI